MKVVAEVHLWTLTFTKHSEFKKQTPYSQPLRMLRSLRAIAACDENRHLRHGPEEMIGLKYLHTTFNHLNNSSPSDEPMKGFSKLLGSKRVCEIPQAKHFLIEWVVDK